MYNWRLLLFAFFAVFQPIASSAERNLVDGRQECCDHRHSRDTTRLNGNNLFKLPSENRHLKERRNIREVRRDDFRNGHSAMISATSNAFYDAQERQLIRSNSDFRARSTLTTFRLMVDRAAPTEIRASRIRNINSNFEKRSFATFTQNSRFRTSDERGIRTSENLIKHRKREINQRENIRHSPLFMEQTSVQDGQRTQTERAVRRQSSVTRANSRYQHFILQRSTRSLDRFTRENEKHRQLATENFRQTNGQRHIRSEFQRVRTVEEGKRTEIRERERTDRDRKLTSRFLSRQQDDKENNNRNAVVSSDKRISRELRRVIRESKERVIPLDTVEIMHIDVNNERNIARSVPVKSRLIQFPQEQRQYRANTRDNLRSIVRGEDRRARSYSAPRMLTSRHDDRQIRRERTILNTRDREVHEKRQNSRDRTNSHNIRNFRALTRETDNERRNMGSRRENIRSFEMSRQQNELRERRHINSRDRSLERERITRTAELRTVQIGANIYQERKNTEIRRFVDYRTMKTASKTMEIENNESNNEFIRTNWQFMIYTMQGIYLCAILLPMLMGNIHRNKKTMSFKLGTSLQKLVKVD